MYDGVPLWCDDIHERNELTDAYFFTGIKQVRDKELIRKLFSVDVDLNTLYTNIFVVHLIPRYIKTFF